MAEVQISHAFVSTKPESFDNTIVSTNEWNSLLLIGGGANGQIPVRDTGQQHGARWTQGTSVQQTIGSYTGTGTSTPSLAPMVVTTTTPCLVILLPYVVSTTSANQNVTVAIRRNTSNLSLPLWFGTGVGGLPYAQFIAEGVGTFTYDLIVSVSTGTLINVSVTLTALVLGT